MKSLLIAFLLVFTASRQMLGAQQNALQTTSTQPQPAPAPCLPVAPPAPLQVIQVKPNSRWQQMLDKERAKIEKTIGVTLPPIDPNVVLKKEEAPHPCPAPTAPPKPPTPPQPVTPATKVAGASAHVRIKLTCWPLMPSWSFFAVAVPPRANEFEADDISADANAKVPCFAVRIDPITNKYWVTDPQPLPAMPPAIPNPPAKQ